jgi:hypothetical protein
MSQTLCQDQAMPTTDPVRRAVTVGLLIYLSPVLLVIFLMGACGVALCAVARLVRHGTTRGGRQGAPGHHLALIGRGIRSTGF